MFDPGVYRLIGVCKLWPNISQTIYLIETWVILLAMIVLENGLSPCIILGVNPNSMGDYVAPSAEKFL